MAALEQHFEHLRPAASSSTRRLRRARDEIEAIAVTALREQWRGVHENAALDELAAEVVAGDSDPYAAADLLLESLEAGHRRPIRPPEGVREPDHKRASFQCGRRLGRSGVSCVS